MNKFMNSDDFSSQEVIFKDPLPCGLQFGPSRGDYVLMFEDIFERQYYTNHGPLAQRLEQALADRLQVRHAMCITNEYIGLALVAQALGIKGRVLVSAASSLATVQPLHWVGATPVFVDADPDTGLMQDSLLERQLAAGCGDAILGINPLGDVCDVDRLEWLARKYSIPLFFDSSQGLGCQTHRGPLGGFGAAEVFSLQADNIVNAGQGGVVCTQDDALAAHVRNIRSNYGMGMPVKVSKTSNGRLSEAQAALALHGLNRLDANMVRNAALVQAYSAAIEDVPGLRVRPRDGVRSSNHQNMAILVDEGTYGQSAAQLKTLLHRRHVMARQGLDGLGELPAYRILGQAADAYPGADAYLARLLQLPMHHTLDLEGVVGIGRLLHALGGSDRARTGASS